jgi:hypothetical protein
VSPRRGTSGVQRVTSGGPDAVHLCLTVDKVPHLWGCAWASYGEARLPGPATGGSLWTLNRVVRARPLKPQAAGGASKTSQGGPPGRRE